MLGESGNVGTFIVALFVWIPLALAIARRIYKNAKR